MSFDLSQLGQAARRFWSENIHGPMPRRIVLLIPDGIDAEEGVFTVPYQRYGCAQGCLQDASDRSEDGKPERSTGLPDCVKDILLTLREHHPRPLTKTRLLEEMGLKGRTYADSTVAKYLALLMSDGTVDNPEGARPRGYRLTDAPGFATGLSS